MTRDAAYVYCLVRTATRPLPAKIPSGLPHATRPELLPVAAGLWLVVSDVPLSIYGPEPLAASLRNLEWVSKVAVAHEAVVEHFTRSRGATALPMKLFTMFSTRERALADVRERRAEVAAIVRRIAGAEEWGVRVSQAAGAATHRGPRARPSGGAAFLAAKKQARDAARDAGIAAMEAADASFADLRRLSRAAARRDDAPADGVAPLLDAAFLVPREKRAAFKAAARRAAATCRRAGASMSLTGPWPAYNFIQASPEQP